MPEGIESKGSTAGHAGSVTCVQFSPDGDLFASGSWDKTIKIWDTESGDLLLTLVGHTDHINSISFAPNGAMICSGSSDGTIRIFDTQIGREQIKYTSPSGSVLSVCFSPNGSQIAAGCENASIEIWDLKSSAVTLTLSEHTQPVNSITYSDDGQHLLSASSDKTLKYWDTSSGKVVTTINTNCANYSAAITPDGKYFVSGGKDKQLKICSANTGKVIKSVEGHSSAIRCVTCSPNNVQIVTAGDDNRIFIWKATTFVQKFSFIASNESVASVHFSNKGNLLLVGSENRSISVYKTNSWKRVLEVLGKQNIISNNISRFNEKEFDFTDKKNQSFDHNIESNKLSKSKQRQLVNKTSLNRTNKILQVEYYS